MQNDAGQIVDSYIPRKWYVPLPAFIRRCALSLRFDAHSILLRVSSSVTQRILGAKDHAAIQLNIANLNSEGRLTGTFKTYAISGYVRGAGESDDSINMLATRDGYMQGYVGPCSSP